MSEDNHPGGQKPGQEAVEAYLNGLGPISQITMRSKLNMVAQMIGPHQDAVKVDWAGLAPEQMQSLRRDLLARYAPSTAIVTLAAVRGVLRACRLQNRLDERRYQALLTDEPIRRPEPEAGRILSVTEIAAVFAAVADDPVPNRRTRDWCLLVLLYGAGLRRAEAVQLDVSAWHPEESFLRIDGQGGRAREAMVTEEVGRIISAWLDRRGDGPGPLLMPVLKGGRIAHRRLRPEAVRGILLRVAEAAEVELFTAEDLRRTWIADLVARGYELSMIQKLVGHLNPQTTRHYSRGLPKLPLPETPAPHKSVVS